MKLCKLTLFSTLLHKVVNCSSLTYSFSYSFSSSIGESCEHIARTCDVNHKPNPHCFCTAEWDPVCGCDGQLYGNACFALCAGVATTTKVPQLEQHAIQKYRLYEKICYNSPNQLARMHGLSLIEDFGVILLDINPFCQIRQCKLMLQCFMKAAQQFLRKRWARVKNASARYINQRIEPLVRLKPADLFGGKRQLEPELAFWSKFASAKAAHVLFWCPCDYSALVFLCYWESINQTR